ncbi:MAG: hypothetical protein KME03_20885 [Aphanocapsa lilacina HA4352-LM1]|jgi:hypothetical protein|nr:hypothetical protein [Aphanocapsa lilacina HA4352-LM1]
MATVRPPAEKIRLYLPGWPFASCRECAVHIAQLGVESQVVLRTSPVFDSHLDQVECIEFTCPPTSSVLERLAGILEFYLGRYYQTPDTRRDTARLVRGAQEFALTRGVPLHWLLGST